MNSSVLPIVAELATRVGAVEIRRLAETLSERLAEGRFYVVCLGQFKRGKSTLLNALIGRPILPVGVAPVTSVVTVIRYGDRPSARVYGPDSGWTSIEPEALGDFVTEEKNPSNRKGISAVEVFEPSALLRSGLCLVDTPGVGSVIPENTAATRAFLPQVDAALVVLGADPPITADELALIEGLAGRSLRLLFVLAKSDKTSEVERRDALAFTKTVVGRVLASPMDPIFQVSAKDVLSSGPDSRDWPALIEALKNLGERSGADLIAAAAEHGVADVTARLASVIEEQIAVLDRPLAESESRISDLRRALQHAEQLFSDLTPLFASEESRLLATLDQQRDAFFREAEPRAAEDLVVALKSVHAHGPALRRSALDAALTIARRSLGEWQSHKVPEVETLYRSTMRRFVDLVALVDREISQAVPAWNPVATDSQLGLRAPSRFYMTELLTIAPASLGQRVLDLLGLGWSRRNNTIHRQAERYLRRLLEVNSARLKNDFRERLETSRRALESEVRRTLRDRTEAAERLLAQARRAHTAGAREIREQREQLHAALAEVRDLQSHRGNG